MYVQHKVDTVVIGDREYLTRYWLMDGAGHKNETGYDAHRTYFEQFCTDPVMNLVKSSFTKQQWRIMAAAYREGDSYLNGCSRLTEWDSLSPYVKGLVGRLTTRCEYAEMPEGTITWSLSTGVCIAKEAARLLIELRLVGEN